MDDFDWMDTIDINLWSLHVLGLWPKGYENYKFDSYLLYVTLSTIIFLGGHDFSQILNIFYVYNDLIALTGTFFVAATNTFSIVKRYYFLKNLKIIKKLFVMLNRNRFRPRNSQHFIFIKKSVTIWRRDVLVFHMILLVNLLLWLFAPMASGWIEQRKLPFEAWYPFRIDISPNYEITYAYQFVCIWYIALSNVSVDILIYAFMMFIAIQCDMLMDDLRNLPESHFTEELVACIQHHMEVLRFAEKTNEIFNIIIFGQIATSTAALALSMFQLSLEVDASLGSALAHVAYIFGMCTEIFYYCWFGNEVQLKSGQIPYAIFESKWIGQVPDTLKNLIILSERCQRPIKITALNLFTFSLETFLAILRSAWSYFAVLSTINK